jgi:glycosyltransferase involved in cell wall biosynthesis
MKIILLADPYSAHVIKWANGLNSKGVEVLVFGLSTYDPAQFDTGIRVEIFKIPQYVKWQNDGNWMKSAYLLSIIKLNKVIKEFGCDILHAHSASSYGLLGTLTNFHPYIISVWGNDIYNFPRRSFLFSNLIKFNFRRCDRIFSTSKIMAKETSIYTNKEILVTPFGIDIQKFKPDKPESLFTQSDIVIGTIKSLEKKYGSEDLITAFNIIKKKFPQLPLKLLLVGRGSLEKSLIKLIKDINLEDSVKITGFIPFDQVSRYHNMLDIYIAPSTEESESFGVAILEASACGKPVIVSNVGGLPEVVVENETGIFVRPNDPEMLAEKMEKLIFNKELRKRLGDAGRKFVSENYNWDDNLNQIISVYNEIIRDKIIINK